MYKVGVSGNFGGNKNLINGQTIKTKILTEELKLLIGSDHIKTLDTYNWKKKPFKLLKSSIKLLINCKNIIILPAQNGIRVFAPLFVLLNVLMNRRLHYVVIGGWLPKLLKKNNILRMILKYFYAIYVETDKMVKDLKSLGLDNVIYLPNFKRINILEENELVCQTKVIRKTSWTLNFKFSHNS